MAGEHLDALIGDANKVLDMLPTIIKEAKPFNPLPELTAKSQGDGNDKCHDHQGHSEFHALSRLRHARGQRF